jgi:hypothetical protein
MAGPGDLWAWLQSMGPGPGNVGPVNGFLPDPTQTPPNVGPGPGGSRPSGGVYAPTEPWRVPPANEGQVVAAPPPMGPMPWRVPPANEGPRVAGPPSYDPLSSIRAPTAGPSAYDPLSSIRAPTGPPAPLASPSGPLATPYDPLSSIRAPAAPLKRRAGAPNLGYYAGGNSPTSMGGARNPTWTPYTNPQDPRIYRG